MRERGLRKWLRYEREYRTQVNENMYRRADMKGAMSVCGVWT